MDSFRAMYSGSDALARRAGFERLDRLCFRCGVCRGSRQRMDTVRSASRAARRVRCGHVVNPRTRILRTLLEEIIVTSDRIDFISSCIGRVAGSRTVVRFTRLHQRYALERPRLGNIETDCRNRLHK